MLVFFLLWLQHGGLHESTQSLNETEILNMFNDLVIFLH